jgi:imidazolonepropionase-like amidohydrolase
VTNPDSRDGALLIRDVTLIDGTGAGPRGPVSIVVEDGVITAICDPADAPAPGPDELDGRGKYVLPGLWETQAHTCETAGRHRPPWYTVPPNAFEIIGGALRRYLSQGVTTVVDLGGRTDILIRARAAQQSGELAGARLLISGGHFNWPGGAYQSPWMNRLVGSVADARIETERAVSEEQIDIVKVVYSHGMPSTHFDKMSPEVLHAICEQAHRGNRPVAIHADSAADLLEAIEAGVDSPEHMFFPSGDWRADCDQVIEACLRTGAYWQLTIILFEVEAHARDRDWLHAHAGSVPAALLDEVEHHEHSMWRTFPEQDRLDGALRFDAAMEAASRAHAAGVKMTISSDSGISAIFHGNSTIREMELHAEAGVPPLAIITMATKHAADKLGHGERLGTVEVGKVADLLVLDADPLASISNLRRVAAVAQAGRLVDLEPLA